MHRSDVFSRILHVTLFVLGVWAVYAQISVLIGRTFRGLLIGAWVPALAIALLTFFLQRHRDPERVSRPSEQETDPGKGVMILALFSITGMFIWRPGNLISAAIYAFATVAMLRVIGDRLTARSIPDQFSSNRHQNVVVFSVIVAAMIITLCEHRVNWDDAKYLHTIANALENPDEPMLVYDNLHGVKDLKIYHPSIQLETYELLVAAISRVSSISYLQVYYLLLPPIWAALAVIAQWVLIRRLAGKDAVLALIATFILLTVWGAHRSYGAFAFDFAGRGIFLSFAVPALISASLNFAEKRSRRAWLFLLLATSTGCLLTSTAYAVAPMAVTLVLIACYGVSLSGIRDLAVGLLAVLWCPLLLAYVIWLAPLVPPVDVDTAGNAHFVFRGAQGRIALILFGLAPFFALQARLQSSRWLLRYTTLSALILLSGFLLKIIGNYSSILSWRLLWAIPVPIIIGVGFAAAINIYLQRLTSSKKLRYAGAACALMVIAIAFSLTGDTVVFNNFGWPRIKIDKSSFAVARSLVQCSKQNDLMLAPPEIAVPIAGLIGAPSLIAVRGHHLSYLSAQWGEKETKRRKQLFNMVQGERNSADDIAYMRNELLTRPINRVLLDREDKNLEPMREMMQSLKIDHVTFKDWEVWLPNTSYEEAMRLRSCLQRAKE